ncbi:hypothetical protein ABKW28_13515 [Nocardioides sp. 31GB23]|uniref:Secreted protein n=2 Tax=Nocardioides salarius TaxID=374513 RepID=A0ABS2M5U0_9ACTN|nr:hypothetical protein [Nocardioides salarius]MBM7506554.1 hypothetical protein [Nocardioides salarius]
MHRPSRLSAVVATALATAALSLPLSPTPTASATAPVATVQVSAAAGTADRRAADDRDRGWARLTTYRRAALEGCRPPRKDGFRRIVLRLHNVHEKRLRRAEISFKDRAYSQPWSGSSRTPWVRPGRAAPLARVSTTGRLVTQRLRVRLRTRHDASPVRSLRWSEVPTCRRGRR